MAIDLDEAFRRAVESYYQKEDYFKNYEKHTGKPVKYSKGLFDAQEKIIKKKLRKSDKLETDVNPADLTPAETETQNGNG